MIIKHHGTKGQRKGIRNYQYPDGSLTPEGREHYGVGLPRDATIRKQERMIKKDKEWAYKNQEKIIKKVSSVVQSYMDQYDKQVLRPNYPAVRSNGKPNLNYVNAYNKKMAEVMNIVSEGKLYTPKASIPIRFVPRRGNSKSRNRDTNVNRVSIALGDGDLKEYSRGVYDNGKIAYRNKTADVYGYK